MKFKMVEQLAQEQQDVVKCCKTLLVSISGYYAWLKRPLSTKRIEDQRLWLKIKQIWEKSRKTYGLPRIHDQLKKQGEHCGKGRVSKIMKANDISGLGKRRFKIKTTDSNHKLPIAERLFETENAKDQVTKANQYWGGDITYVATDEGWLFLAIFLDLFTRKVVGHAMRDSMPADLVLEALDMGLKRQGLTPDAGLTSHTDRGSQYASDAFKSRLAAYKITPSMSRKGNCYDNAFVESFFRTLKVELVYQRKFKTKEEANLGADNIELLGEDRFLLATYNNNGQQGQSYFFQSGQVCPKDYVSVHCDCSTKGSTAGKASEIDQLKGTALSLACQQDFTEAAWKGLTPPGPKDMDEKTALLWMKRFSKPGGFSPEIHTPILLGMLQAGMQDAYPAEMKSVLHGVIIESDQLYDSLLEVFPEIKSLPGGSANNSCLTAKEKAQIENAVFDFAKSRILADRRPTFTDLARFADPIRDTLSEAKRTALAELAADQLVFTAGDSEDLNQIFSSKIYKFSESKMKEAYGLPHKDLTDVTVVRRGSDLIFYQLGTQPFGESTESRIGMSIREVDRVPTQNIDGNTVKKYAWTFAGKKYEGEVNLSKQKVEKKIISESKAPNYDDMWKQKDFRGVVIAGTNLGSSLTNGVMKQYIEYYTQQGFTFEEARSVASLPAYLKERTSGKEPMHYFVKEAHSDGDEKNLFRLSEQGKVLVGTKVDGDKKETIELIYPAPGGSKLLSNAEFGKWMKDRESAGGPELLYVNSSCWSVGKAIFEIPAAGTSKLINIPTTTSMTTFANSEKNVMRAAIDGFRNRKSYEEIRQSMKKDSKYESRTDNVMIFPDEDDYKHRVTEVLRVPIEVDIKLFVTGKDGATKPFSIEDNH